MSVEASRGELEASSERVALATVLAHPLLRELEPRVRADVRAAFRLRRFADGALVFAAGDPAESVFVVGAGAVDALSDQRAQPQRAARRVRAGELLGEEALAPGGRRPRAVAVGACVLVEIPVSVLRRAAERSFGTRLYREERRARRAAFRVLLAGSPLGHGLPEAIFEALFAEAAEERHARGGRIAFSGERACLIVDGLFRVDSGAEEAGFRGRGDMLGLVEALADEAFEAAAEVISDGVVLQFPKQALRALSRSAPHALERTLTQERTARERQRRVLHIEPVRETRVALSELGRLTSAGSLLAIELDRCARCGHCAKACADTHGDARVLRQGEKVIATLANDGMPRQTALLFPVACQHCHEPACLSACPTGAIVRDASAVLVREDLCTGCGACATACPWDAVRMRERPAAGELAGAGSALLASKCDLCHDRETSACVDACPTGAIVRLTPKRDVLELGALSLGAEQSAKERRRNAASGAARTSPSPVAWIARLAPIPPLVALLSFGMERAGPRLRLAAGIAAAVLALLLAAQSWLKRSAWARSRLARLVPRDRHGSLVRPMLALHGWFGALSAGAALLHGGLTVPSSGVAGILWLSFFGCAASGALGAVAYRLLPRRITRLERSVVLPEDGPREVERLLDGLFVATTGQNPALKQLLASLLMPYVRSRAGVLELLLSGRGLTEENARLSARIERTLSGRVSQRLASHKPLVATAVALRAERARRVLELVLGAFVPVHLVLSVVMLVMLALHVAGALT
jgi:Fe-S-cluster-containing hydrogenase component 2/CRP-like cAMP-binding protein